MEILKGMVREKGFEDKECTYMKTDDGKQFYFIEDFQLSNGNIIACSDLSQGVGNKPRQTLGVITPRGEIVIPFENKMITPLENNLLLVERNTPITPNVIDALAKKDDPQTVTKYMNDANTIKSQLKSVMAGGENFVFDNPFSEAALYTLEGVNVGGNYFSFISKNGNDYYLSTNVVGSSILKYDSSVNINGGNTSTESASNNQENMEVPNGNDLGDTNNTMNVEEEQQDANSIPTNQIENENSKDSLNQEPLVPNIEIPLQLQQQVEDTPSNAEEVTLPSVDSTGANQDTVNTPSNNLNQPQEQGDSKEESPKTELNINLPVNDVLGQNNQDFATNTDSSAETDTATTTADNATDQNNDMVNMEGSSISDNQPNEDATSSESDNVNSKNQDMETSSVEQTEENADGQGSLSSEEEQSEESITIPAGNTEDAETPDGELEEYNVPTDEANVPSEDGENRFVNTEEVEDSNEEEGDTTPPLPENEDIEPSTESENVFKNTSEEDNDDDAEEDGGMQVESSLPEDSNEEEVEDDNLSMENNMETEEMEEENYEDYQEDEITNPVIIDATNTIRKLLEENRKQREIIDRQDSEIETLASSNSILKENNDSKSKEIISLRNSMAKYRSQNSTLSRENNNLKATNTRQEELIENLKSQNITLKEQVAGITALGNAVKEATTVIETHQEDFSQPSELSYLDTAMGEVAYQKRKST